MSSYYDSLRTWGRGVSHYNHTPPLSTYLRHAHNSRNTLSCRDLLAALKYIETEDNDIQERAKAIGDSEKQEPCRNTFARSPANDPILLRQVNEEGSDQD